MDEAGIKKRDDGVVHFEWDSVFSPGRNLLWGAVRRAIDI